MRDKLKGYPARQAYRDGCKVSWHYFAKEDDAKKASEAAKHNGRLLAREGYDFGFQMPGDITAPGDQTFHPALWQVVIP